MIEIQIHLSLIITKTGKALLFKTLKIEIKTAKREFYN
ncbi:hypothetical protein IWX83_002467 [Flavobacterium sp. CG_9.1]|uniref:Uncharacterized protein n=1 Tax=Flavobacterium xanthum TaxID=69322 RepID=A0A1M7GI70_9FLAO|nr:hypothetical protein [Flavobacterium sp. CG_9.1]SHM15973.1 hypothetical protein SAMN05443669_10243 [Flavobacterium xanthum]